MKRTICILSAWIMLISMTACGNKTASETNGTQSFQETEETKGEQNEVKKEDVSSSAESEDTAPASNGSGTIYLSAASDCYPYNNGMDSPEEVIEAYLDAVIRFDPDAIYALFNLDEAALSCALLEEDGFSSAVLSSPYFMQTVIYYEMMMEDLSDDDWLFRFENPTKSYFYDDDVTIDCWDFYASWLEETNLVSPSIEKAYLYDSVGLEIARGDFYEFISDDIAVICMDGKYYLSCLQILVGVGDSGYWLYADVISDAYEKEKLDFEANAFSPADAYPANAGMDSPEEVLNAYVNAAKSDNPEDIYALFNTSECKWAAEVYDKMFIEEFGADFPFKLTKTDWLILTAKRDTSEYHEQTESIEFKEIKEENNFFEKAAEYYSVPMPFIPQEVKEYVIESDSIGSNVYVIYSFDDKWYLSAMCIVV